MKGTGQPGFPPVALLGVLGCLALAMGLLVPRVSTHMAAARDARRLLDLNVVREAIERYHADKGTYPQPDGNPTFGGWDVSLDGDFVRALRDEGYLEEDALDPVNDTTFHYRYYVYGRGSYGCAGDGPYYVLGIRNFESPEFAARHEASLGCADRDWGREFAYVLGGGTAFQ